MKSARRSWRFAAALAILGLAFPGELVALDAAVDLRASFAPEKLRDGEATVLSIEARIPAGYHLYSMTRIKEGPLPFSAAIDDELPARSGVWHAPKPEVEIDPNFNKAVEYYAGAVIFQQAVAFAGKAPGPFSASLSVRGQICDDRRCIPFRKKLVARLEIEVGDARAERTRLPALSGEPFPPDRPPPAPPRAAASSAPPLGKGLWGFLLIAFLAGLAALATPCVFPMIPITVSFFSKYASVSMRRSVIMAAIYALSIISTFTLAGVSISAVFGAVGMQVLSSSPLFNLFLFALLIAFAFSLFGLFEIRIPNRLLARAAEKERALSGQDGSLPGQALAVFFMALTFTLVSFTCTVGFIGIVLAEAARGHWFYPAIGMLAFSVAFSLPFFLLAVFPSYAEKLRGKAGEWMVDVKVLLGFLELSAAWKFLSNVDLVWQWGVITRPLVLALWAITFLAAGLYLTGLAHRLRKDAPRRKPGLLRVALAVVAFAMAGYSALGTRSTGSIGGWLDGWLPPAVYPGKGERTTEGGHLTWIVDDIEGGREKARQADRPLFVDFTGYTCTNCRYMEMSVFPKPDVSRRLEQMVRVSAYTDCAKGRCEEQRAYQINRFGTAALPFYAIIDPHRDAVLATFASMTNDAAEFTAFLDRGLGAFAASRGSPRQ